MLLVDDDNLIVGALVGFPDNKTYHDDVKEFVKVVTQAGKELKFGKAVNTRGSYNTIAIGVSYGGGQMVRIACLYIFFPF